uniref:Serpentine receptor class r-10 n=1 Tax=Caenorhabditis tropicalis TaxID=1561998 RepID=A0A1I7UMW9_9PELO
MSWEGIQNVVQLYSALLAIPLNLLLIFLIVCRSPKEIGTYKYLMIYISVFEIIYAIIDVVVSPFAHSYGSTFLVIVNMKKTKLSSWIIRILLSAYCGFYGSSMAVFGLHFVFRYFVATGSKLLKTFNSWMIIIWFSIPVLIGFTWSILTYWPCAKREATDRYIKNNILETFNLNLDQIEYISPYFYEIGENGTLTIYWPSFVGIGVNFCIINTSIFIIVYFGYKCYKILNSILPESRKSEKNRRLQNQLYIALVTQTLIPVILMHIPVSTLYFCSFFSLNLGSASGIAPLTIALYPVLDPLPTMFIIGQYRHSLYRGLCWIKTVFFRQKQHNTDDIEMSERNRSDL